MFRLRVWTSTFMVLSVGIGGGCVSGMRGGSASPSSKAAEGKAKPPMTVLHVASENVLGSGFPVDKTTVLTAAHVIEGVPAAIVDRLPMVAPAMFWGYAWGGKEDRPAQDDWVRLNGTLVRFEPNRLDGHLPLEPGDKVLIGGFLTGRVHWDKESRERELKDFWQREPNFIEGTVLDPKTITNLHAPEMVHIEVADPDFHGMSGGPVGKRDKDGEITVFGIVVVGGSGDRKAAYPNGETKITKINLLGIRRIPDDWREIGGKVSKVRTEK